MPKNLLIVESPAKAKTIEKYLGSDYTVKASYGHVRDLPKGDKAVDIEHGFAPTYEILPEKKEIINELKKMLKSFDHVILATDEDREGEAISWHLAESLGLDLYKTQRIVFNEITKSAITHAIQHPRAINLDLVNAQQARRILDRIVGFHLSPILWRKVKTGLSAGRVQSVSVRLVVEREREILHFNSTSSFRITADFLAQPKGKVRAELSSRPEKQADALKFLESCKGASYSVVGLETKPVRKSPAPPFTTSTLQQEASRKLSYAVGQTMRIAQSLYEAGKITYMRTDGVNLAQQALDQAKEVISDLYGKQFAQTRHFKAKTSNAQEAHEAIRPTDLSLQQVKDMGRDEARLYELIWKRTLASQMADAELERTLVDIEVSTNKAIFKAKGEVIKFEGFLKVYLEDTDDEPEDEESAVLPPLAIGQNLDLEEMLALERFTRPSARYTEAALVKKLEELGIGRPSTYAPTISTIIKREYVIKETRDGLPRVLQQLTLKKNGEIVPANKTEMAGAEKNKLFPTDIGMVTTDFLVKFFPDILDYSFTAKMEEGFDKIAEGTEEWAKMLQTFYDKFEPLVEKTSKEAERASGDRDLGLDPKTGKKVIARLGRFGAMIQIGETEAEEKPRYARLRSNQRLETITLEEAMDLFKLPRVLGEYENEAVKTNLGRFGPYVQLGSLFASLEEGDDPYEIDLERAIALIEKKRKADAERIIRHFNEEVQILKGRWGPYLKYKSENVKLPKDINLETITLEDCERLHAESLTKPKRTPPPKRGAKKS